MFDHGQKQFNLLRWFSVASLLAILPVGLLTAYTLSHFLTDATLQRDAELTAQFIQNCIEVETRHAGLDGRIKFSELLDPSVNPATLGVSESIAKAGRKEIFSHLESLPDVLLATLYGPDGRVIWSTNKTLVGQIVTDNGELKEAFESAIQVVRHHADGMAIRSEQRFIVEPKDYFIENYFPLRDQTGNAVLVAEVYKEPRNLMSLIWQGKLLVWGSTVIAGILVYMFLYGIVRKGSKMLTTQSKKLVELDAMAYVGEMSTAVAHSLRNPLANIRTSAELAQSTEDPGIQRYLQNIINQVDLLARWIKQMQHYARPMTGELEHVDIRQVLDDVVKSFGPAMKSDDISLQIINQEMDANPVVKGNASLITQALHSLLSNAEEAMPNGGKILIELRSGGDQLYLTVRDTGVGMSASQLEKVFMPFQTTKRNGLGVGLPIVKRVMERIGGGIHIESKVSEGTAVELQFRLAGS